eukprot:550163-Hanusia_phi.AAC.1
MFRETLYVSVSDSDTVRPLPGTARAGPGRRDRTAALDSEVRSGDRAASGPITHWHTQTLRPGRSH